MGPMYIVATAPCKIELNRAPTVRRNASGALSYEPWVDLNIVGLNPKP